MCDTRSPVTAFLTNEYPWVYKPLPDTARFPFLTRTLLQSTKLRGYLTCPDVLKFRAAVSMSASKMQIYMDSDPPGTVA